MDYGHFASRRGSLYNLIMRIHEQEHRPRCRALLFCSFIILSVSLTCHALASEQLTIKSRPVFEKSYGHLLVASKNLKLSTKTSAHIRKLAARFKKERHGACVLFTGPMGTAKTQAASLLGKSIDRGVFKVELSAVLSKYIGETEKNLASVFKQAESRHWVLFFDEADALFGKRTGIQDAHDRYANLETGYLRRLLAHHNGLVVLTTNQRSHLDRAFQRRCRYEIKFP